MKLVRLCVNKTKGDNGLTMQTCVNSVKVVSEVVLNIVSFIFAHWEKFMADRTRFVAFI